MPSPHSLDDAVAASARSDLVRWLSVVSVAFGTFVMVTTEFLPIGLLSRIATDLGVSEGRAGLMVTTPGVVAAVAAPLAAFGLQRVDRRRLLLALTALVLVSNAIAFLGRDFRTLLLARFLLGVSVGSFWAFAGAVARRLVDERHGATATAVVMAGISVGTVLGLPLGTVIGGLAGWRAAFGVGAALSVVALLAQWLLLPKLEPVAEAIHSRIGEALRHPMLRAGFGIAALVVLGHFAAYTYLEPYLTQRVGLDADGLGLALGAYGLAGLAGNFIAAPLAERDVRRTFQAVALLLGGSVFALTVLASSPTWAAVTIVGWGLAFGAVPTCVQIWIYKASPEIFETSSAFMVTVFQVALAAGAWTGGLVTDAYGLHKTMLAGAVVIALGVVAMSAWRPADRPAEGDARVVN